jgi:hypothetical protein
MGTTDEALVVIVAEDEGDVFCLVDDDGAPAMYQRDDPAIEQFIKEAREVYGAEARAISVAEFKALPDDDG